MRKKDGGAAFPRPFSEDRGNTNQLEYAEEGMSLRDYFAAAAITGLLARSQSTIKVVGETVEQRYAIAAGHIADAMIAERAK